MVIKKIPPFTWQVPIAQRVPLVLDSPHSSTKLPKPNGAHDEGNVVDWFVDELWRDAAAQIGAPVLCAGYNRAYVDLNRAVHASDVMKWHWAENKLDATERRHRLDTAHAPYHNALTKELETTRDAFGYAWHINCHSMRPWTGVDVPQVVLSDRLGKTCAPGVLQAMADAFRAEGFRVAINEHFLGREIIERNGKPHENIHSVQIELCRSLYLAQEGVKDPQKFAQTQARLARVLARIVKAMP